MHFQWVVEAGSPNMSNNNIVLLTFLVLLEMAKQLHTAQKSIKII